MRNSNLTLNKLIKVNEINNNYVSIYIENRDLNLRLHSIQFDILKLYDGSKNIEMIYSDPSVDKYKKYINFNGLEKLEKKALAIGLLTDNSYKNINDPFVGIEYSLTRNNNIPKTIIKLSNPDKFFSKFVFYLQKGVTKVFLLILLLIVFYTFWNIINSFILFENDLKKAVYLPYWIFIFYPLWFITMSLHEFAHAVACRVLDIHVEEVGIGRRGILFVGWVKPNQDSWNKLNYLSKLFTILVGPLVNILIATIGLLGWVVFNEHSIKLFMLTIGVIPLITLIPTLMPTNKGDVYLALTEYFNLKGLYARSIKYVFSGKFYKNILNRENINISLFIFGLLSLITRGLMQFALLIIGYQSMLVLYKLLF